MTKTTIIIICHENISFKFQNGNGNMHLNTFDCALQSPAFLFCIDTIVYSKITYCTITHFKGCSIVLKWNDPNRSAKTLVDKPQENNNSRVE